jgi:DNA (cytosine-5)-methyltransferase 1
MWNDGPTLKYIDLFSGAGGLSAGFELFGGIPFRSVWANDFNKQAVETYNQNFNNSCRFGDIVGILKEGEQVPPAADIVIGGPPCQGFSLLNKRRTNDPRKDLWVPFFDVVDLSGAGAFLMENVPQILKSGEYEEIIERAKKLGFKTWSGILMAADYGVPQIRRRAFIVGSKRVDPADFFPPPRTHYNPKASSDRTTLRAGNYVKAPQPWRTVRDAIGDLPAPVGTELRHVGAPLDLHFGRSPTQKSLERYRTVYKEGMNRFDLQRIAPELTPDCWIRKKSGGTDLFGRLWWDRPAFTIRTEFYKPEKGRYLHPQQHRPITHREAARLQTFPDSFTFSGSKIEIARQIGNAVPPLLGAAVADAVYRMCQNIRWEEKHGYFSGRETPRDYVPRQEQEYAAGSPR